MKLANRNTKASGGGILKCHVGFPTIENSTSHSPCILIGQMQREAIRKMSKRCQKVVKGREKSRQGDRKAVFDTTDIICFQHLDIAAFFPKLFQSSQKKHRKTESRDFKINFCQQWEICWALAGRQQSILGPTSYVNHW